MAGKVTKTPLARLLAKTVDGRDGCRLWTGARDPNGYGKIWVDDRMVRAHRLAYEQLVAPIPVGMVLDHLCRTPLCVNPDHLEPVSIATNTARGAGPTAINSAKTHCDSGHSFTGANLYEHKGRRQCRACNAAAAAKYKRNRVPA